MELYHVVAPYGYEVPEPMATLKQPLELEGKSDLVPAARSYFRAWKKGKGCMEVHADPIYLVL